MVDMTAMLNSAGQAGVLGGKKRVQAGGEAADQAGFIAVLMAQAASDGVLPGAVTDLGQRVAALVSRSQGLPADPGLDGAGPELGSAPRGLVVAGRAVASTPLRPGSEDLPPGSASGLVDAVNGGAQVQAGTVSAVRREVKDTPLPSDDGARAEQVDGGASAPAQIAALVAATVVQQGTPARGADRPQSGGVEPEGVEFDAGMPSGEAAEVIRSGAHAPLLTQLSGAPDRDARLPVADAGRPVSASASTTHHEAATSALMAGDVAERLPASFDALGKAFEGVALAQNAVQTEPASGLAVQGAVAGGGNGPDPAVLRPFESALRQVDAKLHMAVEAPVRSPVFAQELGDKMIWLAGRQSQVAEMVLNPPQLGSLEVRLTLSGSEAGAQFYSANPVVRETIESALPRLRDMLAQAGINLGEANVRDQSLNRDARAERFDDGRGAGGSGAQDTVEPPIGLPLRNMGRGLVDLYA